MCFQKWFNLQETNLNDLFQSTVQAFPRTTKRQHAIDPIEIAEVSWTPFLGVRTLFVKALAQNTVNGKEYNPIILFKNISYHNEINSPNWIEITANDGRNYIFEKINSDNEVLVRCNCADFKFRFALYDHLDRSLYGNISNKYVSFGIANPTESPGMCKHIIKLAKSLDFLWQNN